MFIPLCTMCDVTIIAGTETAPHHQMLSDKILVFRPTSMFISFLVESLSQRNFTKAKVIPTLITVLSVKMFYQSSL